MNSTALTRQGATRGGVCKMHADAILPNPLLRRWPCYLNWGFLCLIHTCLISYYYILFTYRNSWKIRT